MINTAAYKHLRQQCIWLVDLGARPGLILVPQACHHAHLIGCEQHQPFQPAHIDLHSPKPGVLTAVIAYAADQPNQQRPAHGPANAWEFL